MANVAPVRPHGVLREHYHDEGAREDYVRRLFDAAAPDYDRINRMMSLGSGRLYRRAALRNAGLEPGMRVLDIATGTGLLAAAALGIVGPAGQIIGMDPSRGMLQECVKTIDVPLIQARGEALPFAPGSFDFVSLAYGLRHVADMSLLLRECFRVLGPGGRLLILDFARPHTPVGQWLGRLYLQTIVPALTRLGTRNASAQLVMRYCWDTVDQCVEPGIVVGALEAAGFTLGRQSTSVGIFSEYLAKRPENAP